MLESPKRLEKSRVFRPSPRLKAVRPREAARASGLDWSLRRVGRVGSGGHAGSTRMQGYQQLRREQDLGCDGANGFPKPEVSIVGDDRDREEASSSGERCVRGMSLAPRK